MPNCQERPAAPRLPTHTAGSCASSPASWSLPRICSLFLLFFSRLHDSAPSIFLLPSSVQTLCVPYLRTGVSVATIPVFVCSSFRDHSSIPTTTTTTTFCQIDGYKAPIESSFSSRAVWSFRLFELGKTPQRMYIRIDSAARPGNSRCLGDESPRALAR